MPPRKRGRQFFKRSDLNNETIRGITEVRVPRRIKQKYDTVVITLSPHTPQQIIFFPNTEYHP